jgi:RNA polymerase sigma-70 factor, ECF subfamily
VWAPGVGLGACFFELGVEFCRAVSHRKTVASHGAPSDPARESEVPAGLRDPATQRALVARIRAGDVAAFEQLFRAYQPAMVRVAARVTASEETGAEVVQDVFLKIWRTRETWDPGHGVVPYLFAMTRNAALNVGRRGTLEARWLVPFARADGTEREMADAGAASDALVEIHDREAALARAVQALPPLVRETFLLRWRDHLTYAEVAATLAVPLKTVEKRLERASIVLRRALRPWSSGGP